MTDFRPALFVDRDGTLISDVGYPKDPEQVRLLPGVAQSLASLKRQGFAIVIVSNQSGVGRGLIKREEALAVHKRCLRLLAEAGVELDGAYYCFHTAEEQCNCRKPSPAMIHQAARELNLRISNSVMVGDKLSDIEAGRSAACGTILFRSGSAASETGGVDPDCIARDWNQVVSCVLDLTQTKQPRKLARPGLDALIGKRILVVGDVMLDEYVWGHVGRISQEAPVPVVEVQEHTFAAGGAANTAINVGALQGEAFLCGAVGCDNQAEHLRDCCRSGNVVKSWLVEDATRITTTKTRVIGHGQQMLRFDRERRTTLEANTENRLLDWCMQSLADADCCVLSDYGKGVVSHRVAQQLLTACRDAGKPCVVDPKGHDYEKYRGASVITPNRAEAEIVTGIEIKDESSLLLAGSHLLSLLPETSILITRGADGMSLFRSGAEPLHVSATGKQVFDVTGAGDAVVATLAMALAARIPLEQAVALANLTGGIVVTKVGTCPATFEELTQAVLLDRGETGSGVFCAKHPSGRSGKRLRTLFPAPFSAPNGE